MADGDMDEREEEERFLKQKETNFSNGSLSEDECGSVDKPSTTNNKSTNNKYEDNFEGKVLLFALVTSLELIGLICIILVFVLTSSYMGGFAWDGSHKMFNWHPVLMTIGMVFLYGNAAIIYRVFRHTDKLTAKLIHGGLNVGAFLFAVVGLYAVFRFHNHNNIPNCYSFHSWIGLTTVGLYACQFLFGCLGFLYPKFSENDRKIYLGIHVYFGAVIFGLVIVTCASGMTEKMLFQFKSIYPTFPPVGILANVYLLSITVFAMIVGYILYNRNWKRVA